MEHFKPEQPHNNESKYQNISDQDLTALHKKLSERFENVMSEPVNLDQEIDMNMNAAEIMKIQHDILEIEQELKTRAINN